MLFRSKFWLSIACLSILSADLTAEDIIMMKLDESGIFTLPCSVNGMELRFIFDTGAADIHLSSEVIDSMMHQGKIRKEDFLGQNKTILADGTEVETNLVNLHEVKIGNTILCNVAACVSSNPKASLLLGQGALSRLGRYTIDGDQLIICHPHDERAEDTYREITPSIRHYTGKANKRYEDGSYYSGDFFNDMPHGTGSMTYPDGNIYSGEWTNGQVEGQGTLTFKNGEKYIGQFSNGEMDGQGTYYWPKGEKYVGSFVKGKMTGHGTYYWANGDHFEGIWVNGKRSGKGTYYWANGRKQTKEWKD